MEDRRGSSLAGAAAAAVSVLVGSVAAVAVAAGASAGLDSAAAFFGFLNKPLSLDFKLLSASGATVEMAG